MRLSLVAAALALFTPGLLAHADTVSVFTLTGASLFYGMGGDTNTLAGTTTIDTSTGVVEDISFLAGGVLEAGLNAQYGTDLFVGQNNVHFTISGTTLVGFKGDNFNLNGPNDLYVGHVLSNGPFTPTVAPAVTPEPAGLLGVAGVLRRRLA